jgi:ketopantoate reductase
MLLDFEAKRQMEIEAIIGNLVKFAKKKFKNNKNIIPNITEIHQQLLIKSQKNA